MVKFDKNEIIYVVIAAILSPIFSWMFSILTESLNPIIMVYSILSTLGVLILFLGVEKLLIVYKIVRDGNPGKPDIYIIDEENNNMFIFSLKNLELNKNPYSIIVDKLKPELQFAYESHNFGKYEKVFVYLIVFDSLTEIIYIREINFNYPKNVNMYH